MRQSLEVKKTHRGTRKSKFLHLADDHAGVLKFPTQAVLSIGCNTDQCKMMCEQ